MELKAGGRAVRLVHTHSAVNFNVEHDYWAEPHASVNADFTRVLFTSNWGRSGTEEVDMYMIELSVDWLEWLPWAGTRPSLFSVGSEPLIVQSLKVCGW